MRLGKLLLLVGSWLWVPILFGAIVTLFSGGGLPGFGSFCWTLLLGGVWAALWFPRFREIRDLWQTVPVNARRPCLTVWAVFPILVRHLGFDTDSGVAPSVRTITGQATGFTVEVNVFDDKAFNTFKDRAGELGRKLGATVKPVLTKPGIVELRVTTRDLLDEAVPASFWVDNPGSSRPKVLPLAVSETGDVFASGIAHCLVVGSTGSGKGGVIFSWIRALLPAHKAGLVKFCGVDPKNTELKGLEPLFDLGLSFTPDKTALLLSDLVSEMERRQEAGGRRFEVTPDQPWILLVIDEFGAMSLGADRNDQKLIDQALMKLLTQGRSAGIAVLALNQFGTKESIGSIRSQFVLRVALRVENNLETDLVLGSGSAEQGAACADIAPATPGNDYATAGLGWARTDTGDLTRIRFPYTSDSDIQEILNNLPTKEPVHVES